MEIPVAWVVGHVHSERCQDSKVVIFYLSVALWVIGRYEVVLNGHYAAYVEEELGRKAATIFCDGFRRWVLVKHP